MEYSGVLLQRTPPSECPTGHIPVGVAQSSWRWEGLKREGQLSQASVTLSWSTSGPEHDWKEMGVVFKTYRYTVYIIYTKCGTPIR